MRILLVDDDTGVIQALLAVLKSVRGYEIRVAMTGERALENAAAMGGVDLLITDVVMEPMDGFTLRDEVLARYPAARTILISGYDLSDYEAQTGPHQVLAKPVDGEALRAAIEREFAPAPTPPPAPVPVAVARPIAVPQARVGAGQPVRPTARPAAGPPPVARPGPTPSVAQSPRPAAAQPVARAITTTPAPVGLPAEPVDEAPAEAVENAEAIEPADAFTEPEPEAAPASLVGQTLGAYQIIRRLGEGRWGTVYAALQTAINRPVGLKVLAAEQARDDEMRARFVADARAKANVQHPSILAVYEAGEVDGCIFYAHEYVEGRTLAEMKAGGARLDEPTALKILRTVADGLAYFATHKIPHSPPLPGTIFLGADGVPRLGNLATQLPDQQLPIEGEIQALGRGLLEVLPAFPSLSAGLQDLLKRMMQKGPQAIVAWGPLLQDLKALEPKVVPVGAAQISARDRATAAAVAMARKQQRQSLIFSIGSVLTLLLVAGIIYWKLRSGNERQLDEQIQIAGGEFPFGANADPVNVPTFWIDKYEVTYGQYAKFVAYLEKHPTSEYDDPRQPVGKTAAMHKPKDWDKYYLNAVQAHPVHSVPIDLNCPIMMVDWWDAYAYAKWKGRELPTEQEWEKAARGPKGFIYPWGDEPDPKKANSNTDYPGGNPEATGEVDGYVYWNPVDALSHDKSPYRVIGMAGNVAEWVATWDAAKKHPIVKGGSFMSSDVRLDRRSEVVPDSTSEALGFRTISHQPPAKK